MKEALAESEGCNNATHKKARVMVQVEGEGGRLVRSEIFNMVVKDGEALTYKIMVLPRDDPEVRRLRRQQAAREGDAIIESESNVSGASADTLPVNGSGRVLPAPPVVPNEELDAFMKSTEGEEYYRQWLAGEKTCKMVRERSRCGLLAKFFQRKVEDDEEQKMLQEAIKAEADAKQAAQREKNMEKDASCRWEHEGQEGSRGSMEMEHENEEKEENRSRGMNAPSTWPSFALREGQSATISIDSQDSMPTVGFSSVEGIPATAFDNLSPEENQAELAFAIAAGDVPAMDGLLHGHAGGEESLVNDAGVVEGDAPHSNVAEGEVMINADASRNESHATSSTDGLVQTNLCNWLV